MGGIDGLGGDELEVGGEGYGGSDGVVGGEVSAGGGEEGRRVVGWGGWGGLGWRVWLW